MVVDDILQQCVVFFFFFNRSQELPGIETASIRTAGSICRLLEPLKVFILPLGDMDMATEIEGLFRH